MTRPFHFRITNNKTGASEELRGAFSDDEWALLQQYLVSSYRLAGCRMAQSQYSLKFGFKWELGGPVMYEATLPPDDDVAGFLHLMRPFVLENEPTSFNRVRSILARHFTLPSARQLLNSLRDRYAGKAIPFQIQVGPLVLTAHQAVDKWLNAFEYHRDADKQAEFQGMFEVFPEPNARALFVYAMLERAAAIGKLGAIIDGLAKRDGAERRIRT